MSAPIYLYNQDFIEQNFKQSNNGDLKGIFILGQENIELKDTINSLRDDKNKIENINASLDTKLSDLSVEEKKIENHITNIIWDSKKEYDDIFRPAFTGSLGSKNNFKNKVIELYKKTQLRSLNIDDLKNRADALFTDTQDLINNIETIITIDEEYNRLADVLIKPIIGKESLQIADMIKKLGNQDWVRQGLHYHKENDEICPFCQQKTNKKILMNLENYFDEKYINEIDILNNLSNEYINKLKRIQSILSNITHPQDYYIDNKEEYFNKKAKIDQLMNEHFGFIEKKISEPSRKIELNRSLLDKISDIKILIERVNNQINDRNMLVTNSQNEKNILINDMWCFFLNENKEKINEYIKTIDQLKIDTDRIKTQITTKKEELNQIITKINTFENKITNSINALNGINKLLENFGFTNFKLVEGSVKDTYKIIRDDNTNVNNTLSEGEKTFITFLYFYYLLKGDFSTSNISNERIIVFDDPVSSLDSNIIFIVSCLIRDLIKQLKSKNQQTPIKQIFILTHNVFFHKEVSTDIKSNDSDVKFWVVQKDKNISNIECKDKMNPIKTSYNLLWDEIKNPNSNCATLQNSMRRILEYYFTFLGDEALYDTINKLPLHYQQVARSLIQWTHSGSHGLLDDVTYQVSNDRDHYLRIFKKIFILAGHSSHYEMMYGEKIETALE